MHCQQRKTRIGSTLASVTFILLQVALILIPSLSSATEGDEGEIIIEPLNVVASFMLNGKEMGPLPAVFLVPDNASTFTIEFRKEGHPPLKEVFTKRLDGWVAGENHFPNGTKISLATDFPEGRIRSLDKKQAEKVLKELKKQGYSPKKLPDEGVIVAVDWATVIFVVRQQYDTDYSGSFDIDN